MNNKLRKLGLIGLAGLMVSCSDEEIVMPKRSDYNHVPTAVFYFYPETMEPSYDPFTIVDEDSNGTADIIHHGKRVKWVAKEYNIKSSFITNEMEIMPDNLREAATRAMKADQELSFLMAKYEAELMFKEKENDKQK